MSNFSTICNLNSHIVVKEHTGKTLALKQIECLEAIRDKLVEQEDQMAQSYEQFTVD